MRVIRSTSRCALLIGTVAIKVPRISFARGGLWWFRYGMRGNQLEQERFARDTSGRLCPVLFCAPFGLVCVMRRAYQPRNMRLKHLFPHFDKFPPPVDFGPNNFGFIGRKLVLLDYGGSQEGNA